MTIIHIDQVKDMDGLIVHAYNKLLHEHAMDQHMLASGDFQRTQRIHDLLAKNVELEAENRKLRAALQFLVGSDAAKAEPQKQGAPVEAVKTTSYGDDLHPKGQPYSYVERDQV